MKNEPKKIHEALLNVAVFTNERLKSEDYSKNEFVLSGQQSVNLLIDRLTNVNNLYSDIEFELLQREINSFIRGYENIFLEFELAVRFNQLMDELYMATKQK